MVDVSFGANDFPFVSVVVSFGEKLIEGLDLLGGVAFNDGESVFARGDANAEFLDDFGITSYVFFRRGVDVFDFSFRSFIAHNNYF